MGGEASKADYGADAYRHDADGDEGRHDYDYTYSYSFDSKDYSYSFDSKDYTFDSKYASAEEHRQAVSRAQAAAESVNADLDECRIEGVGFPNDFPHTY